MKDYIVDIVLSMVPPVDVKYNSESRLRWRLQKAIDLTRQEWSEEDEIGLGNALWAIEQARTIVKDENDMGNLWHAEKWLKNRVKPQNK